MRGIIGRPEGGRDCVPICEIDGDRLDPGDRPARKRTHAPAMPFQFRGHRVADDAAAARDEGYAPRAAVRHIEPPGLQAKIRSHTQSALNPPSTTRSAPAT